MVEVRVQSLGLDRATHTPVVILQEAGGDRVLPIWIGPSEASAIAIHLAGMKFSRPLTHDLFTTLLHGLGAELQRVLITRVVDGTYYAEMIIRRGDEYFSIDARPSDSIAIALRAGVRILTNDSLLEHRAIEVVESDEMDADAPRGGSAAESLQEYLRRLHPEDFGRFNP